MYGKRKSGVFFAVRVGFQVSFFWKFHSAGTYVTSSQHSNVQVTITVTCLNFAITGSRILLHPLGSSRRGKPSWKIDIEFQWGSKLPGTSSEALVCTWLYNNEVSEVASISLVPKSYLGQKSTLNHLALMPWFLVNLRTCKYTYCKFLDFNIYWLSNKIKYCNLWYCSLELAKLIVFCTKLHTFSQTIFCTTLIFLESQNCVTIAGVALSIYWLRMG